MLDYSQCTCKSEYLLINEFKHTLTYTKYTYEYDKFELYRSEFQGFKETTFYIFASDFTSSTVKPVLSEP